MTDLLPASVGRIDISVKTDRDGRFGTVIVHGAVDVISAPTLRNAVCGLPFDLHRLTIDFTGVDLLTAAGVQVLVDMVRVWGRDVVVVVASPIAARVLEVCELGFLLEPTEAHGAGRRAAAVIGAPGPRSA